MSRVGEDVIAANREDILTICLSDDIDEVMAAMSRIAPGIFEGLGRKGGRKAAANMTAEQRRERSRKAAEARWGTRRI